MERTANCLAKLDRMNKTLRHEEPDRVPVSDFFWGSFCFIHSSCKCVAYGQPNMGNNIVGFPLHILLTYTLKLPLRIAPIA